MAQPVLVIALLEVFTSVGATGLFTSLGRDRGRFSHFEQVLQFQRFDTRSVERLALVRDF